MPRLITIIDSFTATSRVLTEEDYSYYEVNDPFVQNLISTMDNILTMLREALTTANYESCIGIVCHELATRLEKVCCYLVELKFYHSYLLLPERAAKAVEILVKN